MSQKNNYDEQAKHQQGIGKGEPHAAAGKQAAKL
jgi:hypothetical protein